MSTINYDEKRPQRFFEIQAGQFAEKQTKNIDDDFERSKAMADIYDAKMAELIERRNVEGHINMPAQNTVANGANSGAPVIRYKIKDDVTDDQAAETISKVSAFMSSEELIDVSSVDLDNFITQRVNDIYAESFMITDKLDLEQAGEHKDWYRHPADCLNRQHLIPAQTEEIDVFTPVVKTISAEALNKRMTKMSVSFEILSEMVGVQLETAQKWGVEGVPASRFDSVIEVLQ